MARLTPCRRSHLRQHEPVAEYPGQWRLASASSNRMDNQTTVRCSQGSRSPWLVGFRFRIRMTGRKSVLGCLPGSPRTRGFDRKTSDDSNERFERTAKKRNRGVSRTSATSVMDRLGRAESALLMFFLAGSAAIYFVDCSAEDLERAFSYLSVRSTVARRAPAQRVPCRAASRAPGAQRSHAVWLTTNSNPLECLSHDRRNLPPVALAH